MHLLENYRVLEDFVRQRLKKGSTEEDIRHDLRRMHWPDDIITDILEHVSTTTGEKMQGAVLRIHNVSKSFGSNRVLSGISLEAYDQDILGIIGLSGSGKTTLLNILIGFLAPDEGDAFYRSRGKAIPISRYQEQLTRIFGFAPQKASFYRRLTVWENLDYFASLYNIRNKKKHIYSLLELVGLENAAQTKGGNLSGGMQRRLGIACSLIHDPKVLLLDEPTADLDPILRHDIWNLIRKINGKGKTIIITSHFLSEVESYCSRIAILHNHRLAAAGSPDELRKDYTRDEEIHLELRSHHYKQCIEKIQEKNLPISKIAEKDDKLVIYSRDAEHVMHQLMHMLENMDEKILDIELNRPTLEEVFESFVIRR